MAKSDCCGCELESDYGTSTITGSGSNEDPFVLSTVDPAWIRPMAVVRDAVAGFPIPDVTTHPFSFDTEILDTANIWSIGQPTRFTAPESGIYIFGGNVNYTNANLVGLKELGVRLNGSQILQMTDLPTDAVGQPSREMNLEISYQYRLIPGDYIELIFRTEGGQAVIFSRNEWAPLFWIMYAGRTV